jgi:hypothetical protein
VPCVTMTSTLSRTNSAAISAARSLRPSGYQPSCRWLLQCQDLIGSDTFSLTQEFFSHMLGVRRNTVSVEAHAVQEAGLIRYSRGYIKILNRDGLEDCACECYSVIRTEIDKLMGPAKTASEPGG